jgi:hypothetical protein
VNCPHWLLALISSVFKERPGTHHYCRCWCRVSEGLFRTDFSAGKSPAAVGGPLGSRSDGMVTVAVARVTVNALPGCGRCLGTAHAAAPDGVPELYRACLRTPRIADALRDTGSAAAHRYRRDGPRWPTDLASTCLCPPGCVPPGCAHPRIVRIAHTRTKLPEKGSSAHVAARLQAHTGSSSPPRAVAASVTRR